MAGNVHTLELLRTARLYVEQAGAALCREEDAAGCLPTKDLAENLTKTIGRYLEGKPVCGYRPWDDEGGGKEAAQ